MEQFVYKAPVPTLRNRIQYITIAAAEGRYAGKSAGSCGDDLSKVHAFIRKVAAQNRSLGYHKCDVEIAFDTGWCFVARFDVEHASTASSLLDYIDAQARWYTGNVPQHITQAQYDAFAPWLAQDKIDGFTALFADPQFNR